MTNGTSSWGRGKGNSTKDENKKKTPDETKVKKTPKGQAGNTKIRKAHTKYRPNLTQEPKT